MIRGFQLSVLSFKFWKREPQDPPSKSESGAPGFARHDGVWRLMILLALIVFAVGPLVMAHVTSQAPAYSQRAKEIGMHLKCMCRGCEMSAGGCAHPGGAFSGPCDTAKAMLKEVDQHLAKGENQQQIIDAFVAEYGSTVYIEPPKHGFGLVAWIMPFVYVLGGLVLVVFVVNKWRKRPAIVGPAAPQGSNEKLDRMRAEIARETED
jgi:cytochrome c-type biogenesis protein CcmH